MTYNLSKVKVYQIRLCSSSLWTFTKPKNNSSFLFLSGFNSFSQSPQS